MNSFSTIHYYLLIDHVKTMNGFFSSPLLIHKCSFQIQAQYWKFRLMNRLAVAFDRIGYVSINDVVYQLRENK